MKNGFKLYEVIDSLENKEIRQLRKFLRSPFFNYSEPIQLLFDALVRYRKKRKKSYDQPKIFSNVYPNEPYDDLKLRGIMSDLLGLIEEFWIINSRRANPMKSKLMISEIYRKRNLEKSYNSAIKKTKLLLQGQKNRNADYYNWLLSLQTEQMKFQSVKQRTEDLNLQEISDTNDILYLIQKLQAACAQLSHQLITRREYDLGLLAPLLSEIEKEKYLKIPAIAIYYNCFKFLTEPKETTYFQNFKSIIATHRSQFTTEDLAAPYRLATNYCTRKLNEGKTEYYSDSWNLYREGLSEGILTVNEKIPRFTFANAVAAALRIEKFEWAENFIKENEHLLEDTFREQTISFNLARVAYMKNDFSKALKLLHQTEYNDLMNNMISKIMLIKIYTELEEFTSLESHMDSFQQFIRRREVGDFHRTNILNIIKYLRKIRSLPVYDESEREKLRGQISLEGTLSERDWLLEKLK